MMLKTKYQSSRPCGFRQEDFFFKFLPIKAYLKPVTPKRDHFWPKGYNLNKIGRGSLLYYIPKLKALGPVVSDTKIFHVAPYISLCKTCGHFWPQGYNLNKLGTGPLDDTTYQISKLKACAFRQEDFFMLLSI